MTKRPKKRKIPTTSLDDDKAVWAIVAGGIEPLKKAKSRVHPSVEDQADDANERQTGKSAKQSKSTTEATQPSEEPRQPKVVADSIKAKLSTQPIVGFDRKKARKVRSGRVQIEARIDLHGMRQSKAHAELRAFLHRCYARKLQWVLVITGKGSSRREDEDSEHFDMWSRRESGVLRRNVPRWLEEPDLRPLIISYTTAAPQHGGEGALYIHLRRAK